MSATLNVQVLQGGQAVGQFAFDSDTHRTIKIGRLNSAQLKLEDPKAARIHAVIELSGPDVSLIDMGSTSGTLVNGAKVHKVKLNNGDQVGIGDTVLLVGLGGAAVPAVTQTVATQTVPSMPGAMPGQVAPGQPLPSQIPPAQWATQTVPAYTPPTTPPAPGVMPGMLAQQPVAAPVMTQVPVGTPAATPAPGVAPSGQLRFDPGSGQSRPVRRITGTQLQGAAVESRPHPSLPPEEAMTAENRVLELRIYWGEILLGMHHYHRPKRITIGENRKTNVFISSEGLPVEEFPLLRYMDDDYVLTFASLMDGELQQGGALHKLSELRASSLVRKDDDLEQTYQVKLASDARAIVHWGGATFAMRFVSPPKPIPNEFFKNMDLQYVNMLLVSIFLHLATVVTFLVYPYDTDSLREDLFNEQDRFAKLILEPPKPKEENKNLLDKIQKKIEKKKEEQKPPEEKKKELKVATKVPQIKPQKTQQQKAQEVRQKFSKLFSGSGGSGSILGGGGGGVLSGSLSNVIGTTGSSSSALAGLGIRGSGPMTGGGLGTSRGISGIGTSGRLGGGGLSYGSGVGLGGKKERGMIGLSTPVVMGALPKEVIQRVINENKQQIRYCYEVELQRNQNLEGRVSMKWVIGATGSVVKVQVSDSTIKNANVERCIAAKIKTWQFPAPAGGGIVEVNYPFVFKSS